MSAVWRSRVLLHSGSRLDWLGLRDRMTVNFRANKANIGRKRVWVVHRSDKRYIYDFAGLLQVIFPCWCISHQSQLLCSVYSCKSAQSIYSQTGCQVQLENQSISFLPNVNAAFFHPFYRRLDSFLHSDFFPRQITLMERFALYINKKMILNILNVQINPRPAFNVAWKWGNYFQIWHFWHNFLLIFHGKKKN